MKTAPHTKPPSRKGNPSRRAAPAFPTLRHQPYARPRLSPERRAAAFSLVELLVVIAIMAMMVGLSAVAVQGFRAPAVQQAADQVMSGLSLARQLAITKNTQAAFLVAHQTGPGFPAEPFRHWSVVFSNKGANTWTMAKDWEALPNGTVFSGLLENNAYSPISKNSFAFTPGQNIPLASFGSGNFSVTFNVTAGNSSSTLTPPYVRFLSHGGASQAAIRVSQGSVTGGNATITSTNQYFFIETDSRTGRIRMRSPQSYRE